MVQEHPSNPNNSAKKGMPRFPMHQSIRNFQPRLMIQAFQENPAAIRFSLLREWLMMTCPILSLNPQNAMLIVFAPPALPLIANKYPASFSMAVCAISGLVASAATIFPSAPSLESISAMVAG
jgi:hypothetical protein